MYPQSKNFVLRMTEMAMLAAISLVLVTLIRIPLFPVAPWLVYDMADVPLLLCSLLLGPVSGLITLAVTSTIQAFVMSSDGWVGLVMHFCASGLLVLIAGVAFRIKRSNPVIIIGLILGSLAMTAAMIPLNLFFDVKFFGMPYDAVSALIWPAIVPFNLIKSFGNSILTFIVFNLLKPFLQKNPQFIH